MSKEDDERFWNLMVFKIYATDREIEEMGPVLLVILAIAAVVVFCFWLFSDPSAPGPVLSGPSTLTTPR